MTGQFESLRQLNKENSNKTKTNQDYLEGNLRIEPNNSVLNPPLDVRYSHKATFHRRKRT